MKRTSLPLLMIVAIVACHTPRAVMNTAAAPALAPTPALAPAPAPTVGLSQQNADAVIYQHSSAEIHRLYQQCYELAKLRLDANLARPHTLPAAVIVDIDETVLDNSPFQVTNTAKDRIYTPANWTSWTQLASAKALPGAVEFLKYAADKQCAIYYISNRSAEEKNATIKNLFELGFPMADEAHVLCMENKVSDKTDRRAFVSKGHYVALLCGDQLRDFDERFKDRGTDFGRTIVDAMQDTLSRYFIMLPNPMYGTWLDAVSGRTDSLKLGNKQRFFNEHAY